MADKQVPLAKNGSVRAFCPNGPSSKEMHQMQPGHTRSGNVCSWVPGYRNVATRNLRPVRYIPVIIKNVAQCSSQYYPSMSEMYYMSIQCPGTAKCERGFSAQNRVPNGFSPRLRTLKQPRNPHSTPHT